MSETKYQINKCGYFYIKRYDGMKIQFCPYSDNYCGEHCPHFQITYNTTEDLMKIKLCNQTVLTCKAEEFERAMEEEKG